MFNVERSYPAPESLAIEKQKKSGNYGLQDVRLQLQKDFYNKCYLCEEKEISNIQIDHLKPHFNGKDKDRQFDWNNLFFCCPHCNNTKGDSENEILDCTQKEHKVYEWIEYSFTCFPKTKIEIKAKRETEIVKNTVSLLNQIYNGKTQNQKIESENMRKKVLKEMKEFEKLLLKYNQNLNAEILEKIKEQLSKQSAFSAFKRWIVKKSKDFTEMEKFFD